MVHLLHLILGLCVEVVIQTVFLTAALWIMIKLQKLDYNFLGLLGSAALVNVLDKVLDLILVPFLGGYLATYVTSPIEVIVLLICVRKVTQADQVDAIFTVGVGYALLFGMNLFLLGALMGDLRPDLHPDADRARENAPAKPIVVAHTNPPAPVVAAVPVAAKPAIVIPKNLSVKGLIRNGTNSLLVLAGGTKTRTLYLGEKTVIMTPAGSNTVQFDGMDTNSVTLSVDGTQVKLAVP